MAVGDVPIFSRGALRTVLLLENRLIRGAFTTGRLDAVNLIAGQLAVSLDNAQLYAGYRRIADEQAALRRVATLVAPAAPPREVFAAVAEEVGRLLAAGFAVLVRYDPSDTLEVVGTWTSTRLPDRYATVRWQIWQRVTGSWVTVTGKRREGDLLICIYDASPAGVILLLTLWRTHSTRRLSAARKPCLPMLVEAISQNWHHMQM